MVEKENKYLIASSFDMLDMYPEYFPERHYLDDIPFYLANFPYYLEDNNTENTPPLFRMIVFPKAVIAVSAAERDIWDLEYYPHRDELLYEFRDIIKEKVKLKIAKPKQLVEQLVFETNNGQVKEYYLRILLYSDPLSSELIHNYFKRREG